MGTPAHRILLVDDSAEIRHVWRRVLTSAGFEVVEAANGAEGIDEARRLRPDLIIMDLSMPVLDGISAITRLKADQLTAGVPILVVSGDAYASARARAAGGDAFLPKPVRTADLVSVVRQTIAEADAVHAAAGTARFT